MVSIYDENLTKVLHTGIFKGIDNFGMAQIQIQDQLKTIGEGRMRVNSLNKSQPSEIINLNSRKWFDEII